MSLATLRLFKAVPIDGHSATRRITVDRTVYQKTIPKGFVFSPEVIAAYPNLDSLISDVDALYGVNPEALNQSFHKSFAKVRDASSRQLFIEQMTHYLTTYGAQAGGFYDADRIYIPIERLDVPPIDVASFDLVVIRGLTPTELRDALLDLLSAGVALSEQSVKDAVEVASLVHLTNDEVESVKNREVKIALYELYGITPANPVEFLRYVVYRTTGDTLLIKNPGTIARLKEGVGTHNVLPLFNLYINEHGIDRLGEIFLRFKPLFLALRADKALRPTINRIRRSAEQNHKPMPQDYLNSVTAQIKRGSTKDVPGVVDFAQLREELARPHVNVFRKIRLAQALRVRTIPNLDSIVYKVRNGKSFATEFAPLSRTQADDAMMTYNAVLMDIAQSLAPVLSGRNVYIPDGVVYGLPSTEKQFIGNFPAGTYVQVPRGQALVAGVYWEDQDGRTIDLDLSVANVAGKIGWDGSYRAGRTGAQVLFSGDNTAAPHGASEVFWFDPAVDGSWLVSLNYYNAFSARVPVPYQIVVGTGDAKDINKNFVIDPNRLAASAPAVITAEDQQQNIGLVVADSADVHRFYLGMSNVGGGMSARHGVNAERARKFATASLLSAPTFNDVLYYSGATLVSRPELADEGLDLSPASIDKTTILSLLAARPDTRTKERV